ncbi:hypothetical protein AX17_005574 [Amanita inopinata Kibby_2008]|nr:hypothetical protein AX17_005574 [Amanita inopinata Kibby_2008]
MGSPNMDFFVREVRECLIGDMVIIRFGSCGALIDVPVGAVVVPRASVAVTRNVDYDFINSAGSDRPPYMISKPVAADAALYEKVLEALTAAQPRKWKSDVIGGVVNASADSFYSSQGRQTSFPDRNAGLIEQLKKTVPDIVTLEMETFHLYHLAACWSGKRNSNWDTPPPLTNRPVEPIVLHGGHAQSAPLINQVASPDSVIRAAAAQMVFASRKSRDFITPEEVDELEHWAGVLRYTKGATSSGEEERLGKYLWLVMQRAASMPNMSWGRIA